LCFAPSPFIVRFRDGLELTVGNDLRSGRNSDSITLRRETAAAALKKAAELADDGCRDIAITAPDGHQYPSQAFDKLPADG
jgi:hypothetical protein